MHIKCAVIGDINLKTLLNYYITELPTVQQLFDNFSKNLLVGGKRVTLDLLSLANTEEENREIHYPDTDVFVIFFSVVAPKEFYKIDEKDWFREIKHHCPNIPKVLVGIDVELRNNENTIKELKKKKLKPITKTEGEKKAKKIKAVKYLECSTSELESLTQMFDEVARVALNAPAVKKSCVIL